MRRAGNESMRRSRWGQGRLADSKSSFTSPPAAESTSEPADAVPSRKRLSEGILSRRRSWRDSWAYAVELDRPCAKPADVAARSAAPSIPGARRLPNAAYPPGEAGGGYSHNEGEAIRDWPRQRAQQQVVISGRRADAVGKRIRDALGAAGLGRTRRLLTPSNDSMTRHGTRTQRRLRPSTRPSTSAAIGQATAQTALVHRSS